MHKATKPSLLEKAVLGIMIPSTAICTSVLAIRSIEYPVKIISYIAEVISNSQY